MRSGAFLITYIVLLVEMNGRALEFLKIHVFCFLYKANSLLFTVACATLTINESVMS